MAHAGQSVARSLDLRGVEAGAVVPDLDRDVAVKIMQADFCLFRFGVFAHVGQRLLHQPVDRELCRAAELHRLQVGDDAQAGPVFEFARQNFEGCDQPQVRQRRGPQVLHNAALERNAAVERFDQVLHAFCGFRRNDAEPRLDARHIKLGRRQQGTEFVVQLTGQVAAFVFPHLLQVGGQLGQGGRAVAHFLVQLVAFALQGFLFTLAGIQQGPGLPQIHVKRQQAGQRHQGDADTRQLQRLGDLGLGRAHLAVAGVDQLDDLAADGVHLVHAHVGGQHKLPGFFIALLAHAYAQVHLRQLARYAARQQCELRQLRRVGGVVPAQGVQGLVEVGGCRVVRFQVFGVPGQQIAALTGLGIQHLLQ